VIYPLADLLFLYAMGLYRREAIVEKNHAAIRVPLVVGMGAIAALIFCAVISAVVPAPHSVQRPGDDALVAWLAFVWFTLSAFAARVALATLFRSRLPLRRFLVVGAGTRAGVLLRMVTKEGASLHYDIAFL